MLSRTFGLGGVLRQRVWSRSVSSLEAMKTLANIVCHLVALGAPSESLMKLCSDLPLSPIEIVAAPRFPRISSWQFSWSHIARKAISRRLGFGTCWVCQSTHGNSPQRFTIKALQFVEFFAGKARATACMRSAGLNAAKLDYIYFGNGKGTGNNYYDILTDAGFA